jgi:hypothetical protein
MTEQQQKAHDFFRGQDFLPVERQSFPLFKRYEGDARLMDMTATLSVSWASASGALYRELEGYLCSVWFFADGNIYFCLQKPPAAGNAACSLAELIEQLHDLSRKAELPALTVNYIEERFLKDYESIPGFAVKTEYNDDWSEYVYRPEHIINVSGKINKKKRGQLNKFLDMPNISLCALTKSNFDICLAIEAEWCARQDCAVCGSYGGCTKKSLENMAGIFDERFHQGIVAYIDNAPAGYVIWEKINKNLACMYFAKSSVSDFSWYLYYTIAKTYLSGVEYINYGADMGKPGLRVLKQHMGVHELRRKYICTYTA